MVHPQDVVLWYARKKMANVHCPPIVVRLTCLLPQGSEISWGQGNSFIYRFFLLMKN